MVGNPLLASMSPSMKVPPKRKGNHVISTAAAVHETLNESPSEKEGKCLTSRLVPCFSAVPQ